MEKFNVCVIGSGNWSTAIAKVISENVLKLDDVEDKVNMFVTDEVYEGKRLCDTINEYHVNLKYLRHVRLPNNLVAYSDLVETAKYADIIVFAIPTQNVTDFCKTLLGKIKPQATAISVIKGINISPSKGIELTSHIITRYLKIPCAVLSGVNLTNEIVANRFCEAIIGSRDIKLAKLFKDLFQGDLLRVVVVDDADCVEICSLLKNVIAFGIGILEGMDCHDNIKSALIRFGMLEIMRFTDIFYPGGKLSTFFESCGLSDLITVCRSSRNRRLAEAFVRTGYNIEQLEMELLKGQKILGPLVANAVHIMLHNKGVENKFPIFTQIHKICQYTSAPSELLYCIYDIPDHIFHPANTLPM